MEQTRSIPEVAGVRAMNEAIIALILGTATPGGGFPLYGDAVRRDGERAGAARCASRRATPRASTENVPLLEEGKVDLALVAGEIASAALAKPDTQLRIVAAMYSSPGMFIVRGDSPHRSISDLRGKAGGDGHAGFRRHRARPHRAAKLSRSR